MLGKISVVLLLAASPAFANDPAPEPTPAEVPAQEYTTKKICQTYEVAGSSIPRRSCITKKVPVKKKTEAQTEEAAKTQGTTPEASVED